MLPAAVAVARMLVPARGTPPLLAMCKQRAAAPEAEAVTAPEVVKAFHRRWYHRAPLGVAAPLVVVLVNGATVSAAEVLAAALRGAGRAVIVGEGTYGKGATQALVYQRDGCALLFTAYTLHSGGAPLTRGVAPHAGEHGVEPRELDARQHVEARARLEQLHAAGRVRHEPHDVPEERGASASSPRA